MKHLFHKLGTWIAENKVWTGMIISLIAGLALLTGKPIWWDPFRDRAYSAWGWATVPHGLPGWLQVIILIGPIPGYRSILGSLLRRWGLTSTNPTPLLEKPKQRPRWATSRNLVRQRQLTLCI